MRSTKPKIPTMKLHIILIKDVDGGKIQSEEIVELEDSNELTEQDLELVLCHIRSLKRAIQIHPKNENTIKA